MNWLSAAEKLAAIDRSAVRYDPQACLHSQSRSAACDACRDLCPTGAIQPGTPPTMDTDRCESCLACLPACPYSAFSADDSAPALLTCAARVETPILELVCERHPEPQPGIPGAIAVQVHGCLAGLGAGTFLALLSLGIEEVHIRADACQDCPWAVLAARLSEQVRLAQALRAAYPASGEIYNHLNLTSGELAERPVWDAQNPPLSRRDLFRLASRQGQIAAARALGQGSESHQARPGRDRARMAAALNRLGTGSEVEDIPLEGLGFANLEVSDGCTACGVCARVCPTGALQLEANDDGYRLSFNAGGCTGCGLCQLICAPDAIRIDKSPVFSQVFGEERELASGSLIRCQRCSVMMAARPGIKLCPACEFRRQNPFGAQLPPGLLGAKPPGKADTR